MENGESPRKIDGRRTHSGKIIGYYRKERSAAGNGKGLSLGDHQNNAT
jgi:hypothetical protein